MWSLHVQSTCWTRKGKNNKMDPKYLKFFFLSTECHPRSMCFYSLPDRNSLGCRLYALLGHRIHLRLCIVHRIHFGLLWRLGSKDWISWTHAILFLSPDLPRSPTSLWPLLAPPSCLLFQLFLPFSCVISKTLFPQNEQLVMWLWLMARHGDIWEGERPQAKSEECVSSCNPGTQRMNPPTNLLTDWGADSYVGAGAYGSGEILSLTNSNWKFWEEGRSQ